MSSPFNRIKLTPRQIIDILLIILLLIFVGQNLESVRVKFLFFGFDMPLILIILISFFLGFYTSLAFSKKKDKNDQDEKS